MSVIYIPTELKSYITKMVVLDYLWTTLHSDAPQAQLESGEHVTSLLRSTQDLRDITLKHLSRALGAEIVSKQGLHRLEPCPWARISLYRSLTRWNESINEFYSVVLLVSSSRPAPILWMYTYQNAAFRLTCWSEPSESTLTGTEVAAYEGATSGPLLRMGIWCYTEAMKDTEWYQDVIPGLLLVLHIHLLWSLNRALNQAIAILTSLEKTRIAVQAHRAPASAMTEEEELVEACLDVLEGAARGLERVLPHRDWELFLHYDFAFRVPRVLKIFAGLTGDSKTIQTCRERAERLLGNVRQSAVRRFPTTNRRFLAALG